MDLEYQVALLGQSMGATATMIAASRPEVLGKIPCVLLWVPDPKTTVDVDPDQVYEDGGQRYRGRFWQEAKDADFFGSMDAYTGGIHLVYGENDRYISHDLRQQVIETVRRKGQSHMVLQGQDHSPWEYEVTQQVYQEELVFLQKYFDLTAS